MTRLIVWRHGQTEWNLNGRVQGQTDVELTEIGHSQAVTAAELLAQVRPNAIISSDLRRAADTAASLAARTGLPVEYDRRLRERFYDQWETLTHPQIEARWPAEYARWRSGDPAPGIGVEHMDELARRASAALRDAADRYAGRTVVVVTHGGTAREGTAGLLGWPPQSARTLSILSNCHWTDLRYSSARGWQMHSHNVGPAFTGVHASPGSSAGEPAAVPITDRPATDRPAAGRVAAGRAVSDRPAPDRPAPDRRSGSRAEPAAGR